MLKLATFLPTSTLCDGRTYLLTYLGRYVYYVLTPKNVRALASLLGPSRASVHQLDASPKKMTQTFAYGGNSSSR